MSNYQKYSHRNDKVPSKLKLRICLFSEDDKLAYSVKNLLDSNIYNLTLFDTKDLLIDLVQNQQEKIDCLLVYTQSDREFWLQIQKIGILLPLVIIYQDLCCCEKNILYHPAEIKFDLSNSEQLSTKINLAIAKFINLIPPTFFQDKTEATFDVLITQQRRLEEKLKERLGYLGVYYRRNPENFYRNITEEEQEELQKHLAKEYRDIILIYFENEPNTNKIIDSFVNLAFFSDISISKILEIHMELMDEFSQQIKLEGRSEDILLDYRLALIDIVSHLCEMYRRSIPKEDISFDVMFDNHL